MHRIYKKTEPGLKQVKSKVERELTLERKYNPMHVHYALNKLTLTRYRINLYLWKANNNKDREYGHILYIPLSFKD